MLHPLLNSSILHSTLFLQLNQNKCSSVTTKKQTGKKRVILNHSGKLLQHISLLPDRGGPSTVLTRDWWEIANLQIQKKSSQQLHKALCSPPTLDLIFNWIFPILLSVLDLWEENTAHCTPASKARQVKDLSTLLLVCRRRQTSSDTKKSDVICRVILEGQKIHPARKSNHPTLCYCQRTGVRLTVWHYKIKAF